MAWHGCRKRPQLLTSTYPLLHTKQQSGRKQKTKAQKEEIKEEEKGVGNMEKYSSTSRNELHRHCQAVPTCPHQLQEALYYTHNSTNYFPI